MKAILTSILSLFILISWTQLNISQLGYVDVPENHQTICNDVWGYTDETGVEYALVGTEDGVSIIDISDASNPVEVSWIPGMHSIWRDIKTYGDYAYVTTEAEEGLLIIDLSPLPSSTNLTTTHYSGPVGSPWLSAHNLYQDNGYVYIFGAGRGNGGVIILDVASDPMNPQEVGIYDTWYSHDGYVRDDTLYSANIYDGFFSIFDVTNKSNPILLGTAMTPTAFAHNVWTSTDGNYLFTTDEVSGGYIGAYDVSDPTNIKFLDKIVSSPGENITPHNTHVLGDFIYTSYYADGLVIHDVSRPHNLVEVANFDTSPLNSTSTVGCWGVYPFFNSGKIIATDRQEGLFILDATLMYGCYLEGNVTEQGTGFPLGNVKVSINGQNISDYSNSLGDYATGINAAGSYDITFFKPLYYSQTVTVGMGNGVVTNLDIELQKIPQYQVTVRVFDAQTLLPIEGANVLLEHTYVDHTGLTDINGEAVIDMYYQDNYQVFAGKWGHQTACLVDYLILNSTGTIDLYLNQGIYDDFVFDYGWTTAGNAQRGHFEREIPVESGNGQIVENPGYDSPWDCGEYAYLTGNGTSNPNEQEVNAGEVVLISPVIDLTGLSNPHINYNLWYFCLYGALAPDDTAKVYLSNGTSTILLEERHPGNTVNSLWQAASIPIQGLIPITSTMQVIISISDYQSSENVTELGFDNFSVTEYSVASSTEFNEEELNIYPNPVNSELYIEGNCHSIKIFDVSGRLLLDEIVSDKVEVGMLPEGYYLVAFYNEFGEFITTKPLIKQ